MTQREEHEQEWDEEIPHHFIIWMTGTSVCVLHAVE
jgi:hypothetical protein